MKHSNGIAGAGLAVALSAALAGCSGFSVDSMNPWGGPAERAQTLPPDTTAYSCSGGKRLLVQRLSGPHAVMILFREYQFRLDQAPGDPARYSNGSTTLQTKGEVVSLEEEGKVTYADCRKAAG